MSTRLLWKLALWVAVAFVLLVLLVFVEGSFGHDGLLCEWGYQLNKEDTGCR